jgi:hypothetical protein
LHAKIYFIWIIQGLEFCGLSRAFHIGLALYKWSFKASVCFQNKDVNQDAFWWFPSVFRYRRSGHWIHNGSWNKQVRLAWQLTDASIQASGCL